ADARVRHQPRTGWPYDSISARSEMGNITATYLFCFTPLLAGGERGASHHVCPSLSQCNKRLWRLGPYLWPSWFSSDGHHWFGMVHVHCPHLHGCGSADHIVMGRIQTKTRKLARSNSTRLWKNDATIASGHSCRRATFFRNRRLRSSNSHVCKAG